MINAIELPRIHYFWVLPDDDVRQKLRDTQKVLGDKISLLVSWETYRELRLTLSKELIHDVPDVGCLDIIKFKNELGSILIMVTR